MRRFIATILAMIMMSGTLSAQQTGVLAGRVTDAGSQKPLESANVRIVGSSIGTSTKDDGTFRLDGIPSGNVTLIVSFIGYETVRRTINVDGQIKAGLEIELKPSVLPGQTIVVTATRGRERETPATFSTLGAKELVKRYNTQDVPQLLSELPSTTFYSDNGNGIGYNYLNIRGFDQRRISVMINGIPQNDPEDHDVYWLDFPDLAANLQDIQVQRGAGSSFYGPAAIGGSVNLITSSFAGSPDIQLYSGIGTFNTRKYSVKVQSGLLGTHYALQARLSRIISDGYRDKSWTDFSGYFLGIVRYDESMTTQLNFYGGPIADHLAYYGIPKSDAYSSNESVRRTNPIARPEEIEHFSQPHYELLHEWRINDKLTVNNSFFLVTGSGFFDYDGSWAPYSYYRITPQNGFAVTGDPDTLFIPGALIHAWVGNVQYGWLPRATIIHDGGELTLGAEARVHRSLHWGSLGWGENLPTGLTPDYRYYQYRGAKNMFSLYAHELYRLQPTMTLMVDVQYAYKRYRLFDEEYLGNDFAVPYHFINPRIGLNYNIDERFNVYAQVSHTSREPRLKNLYDAAEASTPASWGAVEPQFQQKAGGGYDFTKPLVKPERLTDIEVGGGFSSSMLHATANFFYMDFRDEIVKSGQLDRFGIPVTGNANRTRHFGVELTASARAGGFEARGNATWSRNRLVQYATYNDTGAVETLNGNAIAGFPDFLANMTVSYAYKGLSGTLSLQHVGDFYTDNFQDPDHGRTSSDRTVDAYTLVHAWISYRFAGFSPGQSIEARLQVYNLLNRIYASHGEGGDFFPGATRSVFASLNISL